jgi:hypothetical protein
MRLQAYRIPQEEKGTYLYYRATEDKKSLVQISVGGLEDNEKVFEILGEDRILQPIYSLSGEKAKFEDETENN